MSATANTATTNRSGTVTVTGGGITRTIAVTQAAATANSLTSRPLRSHSRSAASTGNARDCECELDGERRSDLAQHLGDQRFGSNGGSFTVSASANTGATARTGTVTVTGAASHARSPSRRQPPTGKQPHPVGPPRGDQPPRPRPPQVNVTSNVIWTVTDDQDWLSASPTSGSRQWQLHRERRREHGTTAAAAP